MNDNNAGCFRQNVNASQTNLDTPSNHVNAHSYAEQNHDYSIRIWKPENSSSPTFFLNADFNNHDKVDNPYDGIFFSINDNYLSIEVGTHDEYLISEITYLCKAIAENMSMLDDLLMRL